MKRKDDAPLTFRMTMYGIGVAQRLSPKFLPLTFTLSLVKAVQPMATVFLSARILDELSTTANARAVVTLALLAVVVTFVISVARAYLEREYNANVDFAVTYHLQRMTFAERFMKMDYAHTEDAKLSEILSRVDVQARGSGLGLLNVILNVTQFLDNFFSFCVALALLIAYFAASGMVGVSVIWLIALGAVFALGLATNVFLSSRQSKKIQEIYRQNEKANTAADYYGNYIGAENAAKDARIYNQRDMILKIQDESFPLKPWLNYFTSRGNVEGFLAALLAFAGGVFYMLSGIGALSGAPVGGIVQSVGAVSALAAGFVGLVGVFNQFRINAPFIKPLKEFLTLPELLVKGSKPMPTGKESELEFEFVNVSFKYPSSETYALQNLNLKINAGKRLAVVGLNGSGKTTMIKLLCRLHDPTEGEIRLNGVNIKEYDYEEYIKSFAVVFQDFKLFPLWLSQNVAVSDNFDAKDVTRRLDEAGFTERLSKMPKGIDTILFSLYDEEGITVSGGEAQKIALARALYKQGAIVVLDEPTAALDPISEAEVYASFDRTIGSRTCVFVSHRLSSCKFCDEIAVFDGGRLVQRGNHETLVSDIVGRYHELWNAQASHYENTARD